MDILDGDGDDALEMSLFFDEDEEGEGKKPDASNSGCCVILLFAGAGIFTSIWGVSKFIA